MMEVIYVLPTLYLCGIALFLLTVTLGSWFYRPYGGSGKQHRFLVVIPAHNEVAHIEACLESVTRSRYPRQFFKTAVIADNCSDTTAVIAAARGALVFQRMDEQKRGKGYALDWFFRQKRQVFEGFDAVCVVDADSQLDPCFLDEMNKALSREDSTVIQAFNGVANTDENWRTALTTCALNVFNHLRMVGSQQCFGSAILKGNGMCFRASWLLEHGWPAHSLIEDLELSFLLADQGIPVHYQSSARITSEMPVSRAQANVQRERWENGRLSMMPFLGKALRKGHFHLAMDLVTPPLSLYVLLVFFWGVMTLLFFPGFSLLVAALLMVLFAYVGSAQFQQRLSLKLWFYFAMLPLFIGWKAALYIKWLFCKKAVQWRRTPRFNE